MRRGRWIAIGLAVFGVAQAHGLSVDDIVAGALSLDGETGRLEIARASTELSIRKADAGRGFRLQLSSGSGLGFSYNFDPDVTSMSMSVSPTVSVTAPDPANTSLSVGVPLSLDLTDI